MSRFDRITHDPAIMGGKPCIRGLRVTVSVIVGLVASGRSNEEILHFYPYLAVEDIREALAYAAWRVEEVEVPMDFMEAVDDFERGRFVSMETALNDVPPQVCI